MIVSVYLPRSGSSMWSVIDRGAGIVGSNPHPDSLLRIDAEGNRYGAVNIVNYADRVHHAADRHITEYPTSARWFAKESDMLCIGWYDGVLGRVTILAEHEAALAEWLDVERVDPAELRRTSR